MKKFLLVTLFAACGGSDAAPPAPESTLPPPPSQPQTIPSRGPFVAIEPPPATAGATAALRIAYAGIHVKIAGRVAKTTVDEVMVNDQPSPVEATFSFPLPDDATVTDFADWRDGKRVSASLTGKDEARDRFDKAAAAGKTASLGEQDARTFSIKLAPLPAKGQRRIELEYTQTVHSLGGERTWSLPAKRYMDQIPTNLDLAVDLASDREITSAKELNHDDVRIERDTPGHAVVYLARNRRSLERDVVVRWAEPTADLDLAGRAARTKVGEPAYISARFGFERDPDATARAPQRVVLVLDRSLSMAGEPLAHAQAIAAGVLDGLGANDTVGLVAFAGDVHTVVPAAAGPGQRTKIEAELAAPVSAGGSNLSAALDEAAAMVAGQDHAVVVLMTDGQPTVGDGVTGDLPTAHASDVGKAHVVIAHFNYPSRQAALEKLFPGAQLHYVPDGRAGEQAVRQLVKLAVAPTIDHLQVTVDGAASMEGVVPATLAMGEDVVVAARADHDVTVRVQGELHGKTVALSQKIAVPVDASGDTGLATEWARLRIDDLERRYKGGEVALADDDSLSPDRIRPGDPELRIRAPRDVEAVYAVLPWGEIVPCEWQDGEGVWLGRFLVPRGARDGKYKVRVFVRTQDKVALRTTLVYEVDDKAPVFTLDAEYEAGVLHLRATPKDSVFDRRGDSIRRDKIDLRSAVVKVGDKAVELTRGDDDVWAADVRVELPGGELTLVTTDYAGNAATASATVRGADTTVRASDNSVRATDSTVRLTDSAPNRTTAKAL